MTQTSAHKAKNAPGAEVVKNPAKREPVSSMAMLGIG